MSKNILPCLPVLILSLVGFVSQCSNLFLAASLIWELRFNIMEGWKEKQTRKKLKFTGGYGGQMKGYYMASISEYVAPPHLSNQLLSAPYLGLIFCMYIAVNHTPHTVHKQFWLTEDLMAEQGLKNREGGVSSTSGASSPANDIPTSDTLGPTLNTSSFTTPTLGQVESEVADRIQEDAVNLLRRGVVLESSLCPMCGLLPEDIHHVIFHCDIAQAIFRKICRWWDLDWHDLFSFSDWFAWFFAIRLSASLKILLEGVFYTAWWHLWDYTNQIIFADNPPRRSVIFDDIVSRSFFWCSNRLFSWETWMKNPYLISV
ncbi:hypothetical protein Tco_0471134 [Tanacetum coccineum]